MAQQSKRRLWWRHLVSILVFPTTMTLLIPALIAMSTRARFTTPGPTLVDALVVGVGGTLIAAGVGMLIWTVALFDRIGEGTLGLGVVMGEPVRLVVAGPYRHVRNPMITGVVSILLGEAVITASGWLLLWWATFCTFQAIAIRSWEEPHLSERFGSEYVDYAENVPRWIPRTSAWTPPDQRSSHRLHNGWN
jgi:protein-S-isoprenylcysteine O-methyltransferase Ste14